MKNFYLRNSIKIKNLKFKIDIGRLFFGNPRSFIRVDGKAVAKKLLIIILTLNFVFSSPGNIFAQSITPAPSPSQSPPGETLFYPTDESGRPALDVSDNPILPSANLRRSILVARLSKASFQAKEKIEVKVLNAVQNDNVSINIENDG